MKKMVVDKVAVSVDDDGSTVTNYKGRMVEVYEVNEMYQDFMSHNFTSKTIKSLFWAQFELDYIGG